MKHWFLIDRDTCRLLKIRISDVSAYLDSLGVNETFFLYIYK